MSDGTLFGLIHDLKDRRRAKQVRSAQTNYVTNPTDDTMQAIAALDYDVASKMKQTENVLRSQEQGVEGVDQQRYLGAMRGVAQGVARVRDTGGDYMTAYDQLTPVFKSGFGMDDDEVMQWRTAIEQDPTVLDKLATLTTTPQDPQKMMNLSPGQVAFDPNTGKVVFRNPSATKTFKLKGPDGNEVMYAIDENGNLIGGGEGIGPSADPATGNSQQLYQDPQARGMRNMNPGNIKDGPWARRQPGYVGSDGTFARFNTVEAGSAAQERLLNDNYVNGKRDVTQIVDKYLGFRPGVQGENSRASRDNYIGYVASQLGIPANTPVSQEQLPRLAQAMREFENGTTKKPGPIAQTTGESGWRPLTKEEAQQRNLDPARAWQIGINGTNKGKVVPVTGQAPYPKAGKGEAGQTVAAFTTLIGNLSRVRDEARELLNHPAYEQATGSVQGRLPSILPKTVEFDDKLNAFVSNTVVESLLEMKRQSPNGATGFGQLNKTEGNWIKEAQGSFAPTSPENLKKTLSRHETDAMISIGMLYNIPPEATSLLLQRPSLREQFDKKYGAGMAKRIIGQ